MGVTERRARDKEELRQRILDVAGELIVEDGYANLSIRKIAERIEYAPSTIYLYFKDKLEILVAICLQVFAELTGQLELIHATVADPMEGLKAGMRCYIHFGLKHPSFYLIALSSPYPQEMREDEACATAGPAKAGNDCFGCLQRAVQKCIDAGQVKPGDVNLISQVLWTSIHGLTSALITMGDDPHFPWAPREQLIQSSIDILVAGIRA